MVHRSRHLIAIVAVLFGYLSSAQELVSVNMSSCDKNSNPEYLHTNRLINKELIGDTLNLTIGIVRNCGFYPEINSSYTKDSLNLIIKDGSEIYESCLCCFELELKYVGIEDTNFCLTQQVNHVDFSSGSIKEHSAKNRISEYSNKFIFPTPKEIESAVPKDKLNEDNLKVGVWRIDSKVDVNKYYIVKYFITPKGDSRSLWRVCYNTDHEIIEVGALTNINEDGTTDTFVIEGEEYNRIWKNEP